MGKGRKRSDREHRSNFRTNEPNRQLEKRRYDWPEMVQVAAGFEVQEFT